LGVLGIVVSPPATAKDLAGFLEMFQSTLGSRENAEPQDNTILQDSTWIPSTEPAPVSVVEASAGASAGTASIGIGLPAAEEKSPLRVEAERVASLGDQRAWLDDYVSDRFTDRVRNEYSVTEWNISDRQIRLLYRKLDAGLGITADEAEGFLRAANDVVERAIRRSTLRYKIAVYHAYRTDREEYDRQIAGWNYVDDVWRTLDQTPTREYQLLAWLGEARGGVGSLNTLDLPEQPFGMYDVTDGPLWAETSRKSPALTTISPTQETQKRTSTEPRIPAVPPSLDGFEQPSSDAALGQRSIDLGSEFVNEVAQPEPSTLTENTNSVPSQTIDTTVHAPSTESNSETQSLFGSLLKSITKDTVDTTSSDETEMTTPTNVSSAPPTETDVAHTDQVIQSEQETASAGETGALEDLANAIRDAELAAGETADEEVATATDLEPASTSPPPPASEPSRELREADFEPTQGSFARDDDTNIDVKELSARIAGFHRAIDDLRARLKDRKRTWNAASLEKVVEEVGDLSWRHADLDLYWTLLSDAQRAGLQPPQALTSLVEEVSKHVEVALESVAEGSAEREQLERLRQRIQTIHEDAI
jgi:hypothetical protein